MYLFRYVLVALMLAFFAAGNIQSQNTGTDATQNQTVAGAQTVDYCDLLQHSEKFKNQMIRVRALYETDFEKAFITSSACPMPILRTWVDFDGHWESRTTRRVRKTVSRAKWGVPLDVVFVGVFKTGGRYGHMDMYMFSIEVYKVEAATASKNASTSPKP